jgi:tetratricopeptide (TPR) repeat protein
MVLHAHDQFMAASQAYARAAILESGNGDWPYYRGAALMANGKAAEAAPLFEAASRAKSGYLPAVLRAGEAYLAVGNEERAAACFRKALELAPTDPSAHFGLGRSTKNPAEYEKALERFPAYGAAIFALAQHLQRTGEAERARALMEVYPRHKTTAPPLSDPLMDRVLELNAGPTALIQKAQAAAAQGQMKMAIELHEKALSYDPKMAQAHINLISLHARNGSREKAAEAYRAAVALNPKSAEAHYNYGVLSYQAGDRAAARAAFEKALEVDPGHADSHHNLGAILQEQGQIAAAKVKFEKAIELNPSQQLARFNLGRIYANEKRYPEAIAQFERAVAIGETEQTPVYLYALGAAQARAGDRATARQVLQMARQKASARGQTAVVGAIDVDLGRLQ